MKRAAAAKKKTSRAARVKRIDPSELPGARRGKPDASFGAELATLVSEVPQGDGWIHELKLDGYRLLCSVHGDRVQIVTRNKKDWTGALPMLEAALGALGLDHAMLDGELVALDPKGRSDFQRLQNALGDGARAELHYFAFDLPFASGYDLRAVPLLERKRLLRSLIPESSDLIRFSDHVEGDGQRVLDRACAMGAEGIISKRAGSPYQGRRTKDWLKIKCLARQELVIGGYTEPGGARTGFGALLLGYYDEEGELIYCGKVGTGFGQAVLDSLSKALKARERTKPSFANPPKGSEAKGAHWVRPDLVAEISFTEWTGDGHLRHPSFQGLRKDKPAESVRRETAAPTPKR